MKFSPEILVCGASCAILGIGSFGGTLTHNSESLLQSGMLIHKSTINYTFRGFQPSEYLDSVIPYEIKLFSNQVGLNTTYETDIEQLPMISIYFGYAKRPKFKRELMQTLNMLMQNRPARSLSYSVSD